VTRAWVPAGAFAAALVVPGYATGIFHGPPLGVIGCVLLTLAIAAACVCRRVTLPAGAARACIAAFAFVAVAHASLAVLAPRPGWLAAQYRNDRFDGPAEGSTEFSIPGATRIDRAIRFADDYLPVYFLNEAGFNEGIRREVARAYSVRWTGHVQPAAAERRHVTLEVRGSATIAIDGTTVLAANAPPQAIALTAARDVDLPAGPHVVTVNYVKPANIDPLIDVGGLDAAGSAGMIVMPKPATDAARRLAAIARPITALLDVAVIVLAAALGWMLLVSARRQTSRLPGQTPLVRAAACAMFLLFVAQGAVTARPHVGRAESLSGGDDWLAYEARAREVAVHGLAMAFDLPIGKAEVFSYYPGYSYTLAAIHEIGGEDFAAAIFAHFVLLFGANVFVYAIARRLFGAWNALASTAMLVVVEELAFMRYYTVQLFSENLYFFTIALTIALLVRFADEGRTRDVVAAGASAGASALVRSAVMMYLPFALVAVAAASWRRKHSATRAAGHVALLVGAWGAVVLLATARNYIVAGNPVLIVDNTLPMRSFILYNLPDTKDAKKRYLDLYDGTQRSATTIFVRMIVDYPAEFVSRTITKTAFSFGALQTMGQRLHPELLVPGVAYLAAVLLLPAARAVPTWPVHGFVLSHVIGMVLSMPSNYGYRLILPMHLFFSMFLVALVERVLPVDLRSRIAVA